MAGDERLSRRARRAMDADDAELILSAAAVWEIAIKVKLGRLTLPDSVEEYVTEKIEAGLQTLPVDWQTRCGGREAAPSPPATLLTVLLVAQALTEGLPLVTGDPALRRLWREGHLVNRDSNQGA